MNKWKAGFITAFAAMLLLGILYLTDAYAIRWFRVFEMILAVYGYIQAVYIFYKWLTVPTGSADKLQPDVPIPNNAERIPDAWINPFSALKNDKTSSNDPKNLPSKEET